MSGTMNGIAGYSAAKAQKKAAYANADTIEAQSKANLMLASKSMADMSGQGEQAMSKARATTGASGLTNAGSGITREQRVASALSSQLEVSGQNAAQSDINARYQATMTRYEGDMAKETAKSGLMMGIATDVIGAVSAVATAGMSTAATAATSTAGAAAAGSSAASSGIFSNLTWSQFGTAAINGAFRR